MEAVMINKIIKKYPPPQFLTNKPIAPKIPPAFQIVDGKNLKRYKETHLNASEKLWLEKNK